MMTDKNLIFELRKLRQIKPSQDWVVLTKNNILREETMDRERVSIFSFFRPAYAGLLLAFVLFGLFGFSQSSLPGDLLYPVKKLVEKGQAVFVSEADKPAFQLKLANERLEDLAKAPAKNLVPTLNEFQENVSQAAKDIKKIDATTSDLAVMKKIVEETKKLEEGKQKVEALGVVVKGTEELTDALSQLVGDLIADLEKRTLTEEKGKLLVEMKKLFEEGKYSQALEVYLINP